MHSGTVGSIYLFIYLFLPLVRPVHTQRQEQPSSMDVGLPPFGLNEPVMSVQAQLFLHWQAAPVLLPGGWLRQLSIGFVCRGAAGATEFVATVHVVCTPTGHVVVSPLPVPEIHCGLLFVFNFSLLWAKQKYSNSATQQNGPDSGMFRLKIRDKGFLAYIHALWEVNHTLLCKAHASKVLWWSCSVTPSAVGCSA